MTISRDYLCFIILASVVVSTWVVCVRIINTRRLRLAREHNEPEHSNVLPYFADNELPLNLIHFNPVRVQRMGLFISQQTHNMHEMNNRAQLEANMYTMVVANSIISSSRDAGRPIVPGHVMTSEEAEDININPFYMPEAKVTRRNRFMQYLSTLPVPLNFVTPQDTLVTGEPIVVRDINEECANLYGRATYLCVPPEDKYTQETDNTLELTTSIEESKESCEEHSLHNAEIISLSTQRAKSSSPFSSSLTNEIPETISNSDNNTMLSNHDEPKTYVSCNTETISVSFNVLDNTVNKEKDNDETLIERERKDIE